MTRRRSRQPRVRALDDLRDLRARGYVRESTERQAAADRFGPDAQRAAIGEFCARHGLVGPDQFYADAASGRSIDRRFGLRQALEDAQARLFDVLVVFHSSRFARKQADSVLLKREFATAGVTIVTVDGELIAGNPQTKLIEGVHELIDEKYSDDLSLFVTTALDAKSKRGMHNGTVPLGYRRTYGPPGDPENGMLEIVPSEAESVRLLFETYAAGRESYSGVARIANVALDQDSRPRHRTRAGTPFSASSIREILGNPVYVGQVTWRRGEPDAAVRPGPSRRHRVPRAVRRGPAPQGQPRTDRRTARRCPNLPAFTPDTVLVLRCQFRRRHGRERESPADSARARPSVREPPAILRGERARESDGRIPDETSRPTTAA